MMDGAMVVHLSMKPSGDFRFLRTGGSPFHDDVVCSKLYEPTAISLGNADIELRSEFLPIGRSELFLLMQVREKDVHCFLR